MRPTTLLLAVLVLHVAAFSGTAPGAEAARWEPAKTFALFAGVLSWQDKGLATYPTKDRQDRALEKRLVEGGVPAAQIVFLEDKEATREAILRELARLAAAAGEGSTFLFYYAGHGMQDDGGAVYFANYDADPARKKDTCLALKDVSRVLKESFKGSRLLLAADCCYSGALARVVKDFEGTAAACLTSATASNVSTAEWTFTASLAAAFAGDGAVDTDADGTISFTETDAYVSAEMRFLEGQFTRAAKTAQFDGSFSLRAVAGDRKARAIPGPFKLGQFCESRWEDKWWRARVIDGREGESKVHYLGFGAEWDEWVKADRLREPQGIGVKKGAKVKVEWKKTWWAATVLEVEGDFALIHYDGYGPEWDEWVTEKRVKLE